jgi:hypothetical protein
MTKSTQTATTADTARAAEEKLAELRVAPLDDAHLAWFIAESECAEALRAWREGCDDVDLAFCCYIAALDREESAARHLERLWKLSEPCAPTLMRRMNVTLH